MIANEITLRIRPNDSEITNYWSPYGLQQCQSSYRIVSYKTNLEMTNVNQFIKSILSVDNYFIL